MKLLRVLRFLLLLILTIQFSSCDKEIIVDDPVEEPIDLKKERQEMATHILHEFIYPNYGDFIWDLVQFQECTESAILTNLTANRLDELRMKFKAFWLSWQDVVFYQFGPLLEFKMACRMSTYPVDTALINLNIATPDSLTGFANKSLSAIDYILNNENALVQLSDPQRMGFLLWLINKLENSFFQINFDNEFFLPSLESDSNNGTSVTSSLSRLVTATDLCFRQFILDAKIAIPAGVYNSNIPRPQATEAFYGGYSVELLQRSLISLQKLFKGSQLDNGTGKSFLNYLQIVDQQDLADTIEAKIEECIQKANQLSDPLSNQINNDLNTVLELITTMEELSALIHHDMVEAMRIGLGILEIDCN